VADKPIMTDSARENDKRAALAFWLLVGIIAAIGAGKSVQSDTFDPDLFWHLKVADQLRAEGIHPIVDHLSFSSIREPWTPYSWLAELAMKWSWDHLGWRIAVLAEAVMTTLIVAVIALSCLALAGPGRRFACVIATALGAGLTIPFISFRPITIAMVLLACCAWLLLRERRRQSTRAAWLIVPITALLTNIHLAAVMAPIWVGCLLIGAFIERKDVKHYAILLALSSLACLATPMLAGAVRTAWYYQSTDVMVASDIIAEMRPVYRGVGGIATLVGVAVLVAIAIQHRKRIRAGEWIWLAVGAFLMFRLAKFTPMFAMILAPVVAATLPGLRDIVLGKPAIVAALACSLAVALVRISLSFPGRGASMDQWINRRGNEVLAFPTAAANYIEQSVQPRTGRLINEFNWGGYLAWRLGDRYQVFLDGRTQLFTPQFWRQTYLSTDQDAADAIARADADAAVIPVAKNRFRKALSMLGWTSIYRDEFAEVLIPPK